MNGIGFQALRRTLLVGSLALATGAVAQSSTPSTGISDAQVEANVLRALATAPDLANQNIQSTSVFGTVTLTGNVHDDAMRSEAENLVARTAGVKKVVDELALGDTPPPAQDNAQADNQGAPQPDQQQGSPDQQGNEEAYAQPAPGQQPGDNAPPAQDQGAPYNTQQPPQPGYQQPNGQPYPPQAGQQQYPGGYGPPQDQSAPNGQQPYPPQAGQQQPNGQPYPPQGNQQYPGGYGPPQNGQYPDQGQAQAQGQYPPDQSQSYGPPPRRPLYQNGPPQNYAPQGGQQAGLPVTVPSGALLRVRINRGLDSNHIKPGTPFDGTVLSDIPADGAIAIPRGASVQGVVVDAAKTKALSGKGELALQINSVTLGGVTYPLATDVWQREGRDKTASTVNHAVGLGVLGAIIGGVAGGGAGAAIGAGVGAGAGVASSAGTPGGRVIVPPEAVLTFHLAQPAVVKTVSEQEMSRLAYAAGAAQQPPMRRYYNPNYGYYYAPY